jgi:hypothetical protein
VLDLVVETKTGLGFDNGLDDAVNRILGNLATRTLPNGLGGFKSSEEAWTLRVASARYPIYTCQQSAA